MLAYLSEIFQLIHSENLLEQTPLIQRWSF